MNVIAEDQPGFLSVTGPCNLTFPDDHGPHPGYRTEWWYYTGNLRAKTGDRFGFQLTFFRSRITPPGAEKRWPQPRSAWRTPQLIIGHAAISDLNRKRHLQSELIARESLGMAGVFQKSGATFLTIKSWWAKIETGKHTLRADTNDFSFELTLKPSKPPVLHGQAGYSRKGSTPERASCYYSFSRLISKGTLTVDDKTMKVEGLSWMDHEFSTALLEPGIVGWDWFGLQLSDRTEIMLFRLRNEKGGLNPASSGTFIDAFGKPLHLTKENFSVEILDRWESAHSGAVYPSRWRITAFPLAMQLTVQANISDQEMQTPASTGVSYWEGSVSVNGSIAEHPVSGMGYVELTGYAKSFKAAM